MKLPHDSIELWLIKGVAPSLPSKHRMRPFPVWNVCTSIELDVDHIPGAEASLGRLVVLVDHFWAIEDTTGYLDEARYDLKTKASLMKFSMWCGILGPEKQ